MNDRIKTAADNLLERKEITKSEHGELCKVALKFGGVYKGAVNLGEKSGDIFNALKSLALIAGTGLAAKELVVDPLIEKNKINKSFQAMTEKVPQLAEQDQDKMRDYFGVIKTFSPKAASNPLVAGALVNKMMQFGGVDHKLVQDISAIQAGLPSTKIVPVFTESIAKSMGSAAIPSEKTTANFDPKVMHLASP